MGGEELLRQFEIAGIQLLRFLFRNVDKGFCADFNKVGYIGLRFLRWAMAHASSANSSFGGPVSARMVQIHLQIILFAHSATPFCSGVYGTISSWWIPILQHNSTIWFWYSPPPSIRIDLMQHWSCSKLFLNLRKHSLTSFDIFIFSTKRCVIRVVLSINVRKYLDSPNATGLIHPQMSLWMRSPGSLRHLIGASLLRLRVWDPEMHASHHPPLWETFPDRLPCH